MSQNSIKAQIRGGIEHANKLFLSFHSTGLNPTIVMFAKKELELTKWMHNRGRNHPKIASTLTKLFWITDFQINYQITEQDKTIFKFSLEFGNQPFPWLQIFTKFGPFHHCFFCSLLYSTSTFFNAFNFLYPISVPNILL